VLDTVGNVWEWCRTVYRKSYEEPAVEEVEGKASRVLRGGSFGVDVGGCRCAARFHARPGGHDDGTGFRVAAPI
jgi:formylglycine-generating enzyme required for sulfatase activity